MKVRNHQKGFSFIEVIIGLLIVGLVLIIYHAAGNTLILQRNVKHQDLALRIAENKLEELRSLPYSSLPATGTFSHPLITNLPSGSASLTISDYNSRTKEIRVQVNWQESGAATTHNVILTTLITQNGL
jgi:prepilin-type N-terminal cleavage/methylation domain-containing protein